MAQPKRLPWNAHKYNDEQQTKTSVMSPPAFHFSTSSALVLTVHLQSLPRKWGSVGFFAVTSGGRGQSIPMLSELKNQTLPHRLHRIAHPGSRNLAEGGPQVLEAGRD